MAGSCSVLRPLGAIAAFIDVRTDRCSLSPGKAPEAKDQRPEQIARSRRRTATADVLDHSPPRAARDAFRGSLGPHFNHQTYLAAIHAWDLVDGTLWDSLTWLPIGHAAAVGPWIGLTGQDVAAGRVVRVIEDVLGLTYRTWADRP